MATSRNQFVSMLWPSILQASQATGVDPRIIVAQAAQETGWGKHAPNNNYFGIKSHGKSGGQNLATTEYVNGKPVRVNDSFRGYASPADSVRGYADFLLENPRYTEMRNAKGLEAQIAALGRSGYATDPNYASSIRNIATNLPAPASLSPQAQQFVNNNPQPGGYGPGISDPNAPKAMMGSLAPMQSSGGTPIPQGVAEYAGEKDKPSLGDRLTAAGKFLQEHTPSAPRISGGMGDARGTGNSLLKVMNEPTIASMLLRKRL